MIIKCTNPKCKHEFQDRRYGAGYRVMNPMRAEGMYRCTVCLTEQEATDWKEPPLPLPRNKRREPQA